MDSTPPTLSRTSSTTSISSGDETVTTPNTNTGLRRTRKRFTNVQLTMLENLFHQNSHPTREERESVAKAGGMEIKSVTIWFQNKRQTERKSAASNGASTSAVKAIPRRMSSPSGRSSSASSSRPSLITSPHARNSQPSTAGTIWDNMPSSPIAPPASPPAREYVGFGKSRRTLEWACAAARLADKDGHGHKSSRSEHGQHHRSEQVRGRPTERELNPASSGADAEATDDEDEIVTPQSSWGRDDSRWTAIAREGLCEPMVTQQRMEQRMKT
ncbi:hypothetical protein BDQ17DRAFT_1322169 [Cyathus striatus]|nr:hypothetical protein BDQ17DRAFT_1322169 [Cyathus striatus]